MRWSSCPGRRQAATGSVAGAAGGARRLGLEQELPGELTPIVLPLAEEESGLFHLRRRSSSATCLRHRGLRAGGDRPWGQRWEFIFLGNGAPVVVHLFASLLIITVYDLNGGMGLQKMHIPLEIA
jgi:hypothetical protein